MFSLVSLACAVVCLSYFFFALLLLKVIVLFFLRCPSWAEGAGWGRRYGWEGHDGLTTGVVRINIRYPGLL